MIYSYSQINQYLRCPQRLSLPLPRWLAGKRNPLSHGFGRLASRTPWSVLSWERTAVRHCSRNGVPTAMLRSITKMAIPGTAWCTRESICFERFAQDNLRFLSLVRGQIFRIKILLVTLPNGSGGLSLISMPSAKLTGCAASSSWKTTTSRYLQDPDGLLSLDPQLVCYSWISGISEVAMVVFVRKHAPEIQYLEGFDLARAAPGVWSKLVETTINQIEAGHFNPHSGIRFPQNGCVSCSHLGLCLKSTSSWWQPTSSARQGQASDLDWLDELVD